MPAKTHHVYVIELSREILYSDKFKQKNPRMNVHLVCFYVGATSKSPKERFYEHKDRYNKLSSYWPRKYGVRLRPDIYSKYNPMTRREAYGMEKRLARLLREKGHGVWQN